VTITFHAAGNRGRTKLDWLDSKHSFSFNDFYDQARMGFGALRVLNEDVIAPGKGFGTHPHQDMEIVTIVLEGALRHEDSMGNEGVIPYDTVQRMTAGTGVRHSEMNDSKSKPVHLLQIWIEPNRKGLPPGYEQKSFAWMRNRFVPIVSFTKDQTSVYLHQDATMHAGRLDAGFETAFTADADKGVYVFLIHGHVRVEDTVLSTGDAVAITEMDHIPVTALKNSDVLIIQVPLAQQ